MTKIFRAFKSFSSIKYLSLLAVGIFLLVVRNADPILNPIIYTEDGLWSGMAMTHGWLHTFFYAKEGYLVWGNLIALWISNIFSFVLCGDRLICLPQGIAYTSYIYFSSIAVLSFFATKSYLRTEIRILLFMLFIFLPLGDSSNEIFGRLSNIGYYLVFVSLILILIREDQVTFTSKSLIDAALIVCMATNPVCILLVFFHLLMTSIFKLQHTHVLRLVRENLFLVIGFLIISIIVAVKKATAQGSAITGEFNVENIIEVVFARSILYPFIFPFYTSLNNLICIAIFLMWSLLIGFGFYLSAKKARIIMLLSTLSMLVYLAFTIYMRQSLTEQLGNYSVTFPDRYFMGINIMVVFITLMSLNAMINSRYKSFSYLVIIFVGGEYIYNLNFIVEYKSPRFPIAMHERLDDQICLNSGANWLDQPANLIMPTPNGWGMEIPPEYVRRSVLKLDCKRIFSGFYITDINWNFGVSKNSPTFFVLSSTLTRSIFSTGKQVKLANGEVRKILSISQAGRYLNIYLDGGLLNIGIHGLPHSYVIYK